VHRDRFDAVTFAYPARPGTPALDRFSLTVRRRRVAVPPAGKPRCSRFCCADPQQGRAHRRTDLREYDPPPAAADCRRAAGPAIFAGSVLDNVRYAVRCERETPSACEQAFALEFTASLGMDTSRRARRRSRAASASACPSRARRLPTGRSCRWTRRPALSMRQRAVVQQALEAERGRTAGQRAPFSAMQHADDRAWTGAHRCAAHARGVAEAGRSLRQPATLQFPQRAKKLERAA
jgi:hypothetical protein